MPEEQGLVLFKPDAIQVVNASLDAWLDDDNAAMLAAVVDDLLSTAAPMQEITSGAAYEIVEAHFRALGDQRKAVEAHYGPAAKFLNGLHKKVTGAQNAHLARLRVEENRLGRLAGAWQTEQERKRGAEQKRLHDEAQAQAAADAAKAAEAAKATGASPAEVEAIKEAPPAPPPPQLPKSDFVPSGTGSRRRVDWKGHITDMVAFLDAVVQDAKTDQPARYPLPEVLMGMRLDARGVPSTPWINKTVKAAKGKFQMPGVLVFDDGKLARQGDRRAT